MNHKRKKDNPWRAAGLVGAMGIDIAGCIMLGYWGGKYIANHTAAGSQGWIAGGVLTGLAVGILSCVWLLKLVLGDGDD